jgi:hypothetical protein
LAKTLGGNKEEKAAFHPSENLEITGGCGNRRANGLAVADQNHTGADDLGAGSVRDYATDGGRQTVCGNGDKQKQSECARQRTRKETTKK